MVAEVVQLKEQNKQIAEMHQVFEDQKFAFSRNPMPTFKERADNLKKLRKAMLANQDAFVKAIAQDFSCRSEEETKLAEIMSVVTAIDYYLKNTKAWMASQKRKVNPLFQPATAMVQYQPKGVVGIIAPWNYTLTLSFGPLVAALAAGNRVMIKMSEFTPTTSELVEDIIHKLYPRDLVAIVNGDAEVATAFSSIAWDHMLFTGSTAVGKHVMRAAAENLTPVTLELGGKSPAIISDDIDMDEAIQPIVFGKAFNAGQTCIAPDYILCPESRLDHFVDRFQHYFAEMYPTLKNNDDYTAVINERQYQRLKGVLADAEAKGATVIACNHAGENMDKGTRKMPIHLVLDATEDMLVLQDEIFGPILPIVTTSSLDESLDYINARPRPLALYYFGHDSTEQEYVMNHTHAGGMCINDAVAHFAQEDMHFGGIGESGMGAYHGEEGFRTFSHAKSIFKRSLFNSTKFAYPPYDNVINKAIFKIFLR